MGIQGLTKLLGDHAPNCIKPQKFDNYFGRKIAVDASMHIYQFLIAVGRVGDQLLTNEAGEVTSHLQGMFFRTARMLEAGIKPVYVFDGKPPQLKLDLLEKRFGRREDATDALQAAKEAGDQEAIEKYSKRTVKVTREQNEECKRLLRLMGVPVVEAPSEAEAQCASMAKAGLVYGVATEDMDCLTFGCPKVIRHLMASSSSNLTINEFDLQTALNGLGIDMEQFIAVCILCGCDYCSSIKGIGPVRALQLIQKHKTIEAVLKELDPAKYQIPTPYPHEPSAEFFRNPDVLSAENMPPLKWTAPDEEGLVAFLVAEKSFNEDRIRKTVAKIVAAKGKSTQGRLESFFGPATIKPKADAGAAAAKRKGAPAAANKGAANKKGKLGGVGGKKK